MDTMISFKNERSKNVGLQNNKICHNINVNPSSYDRHLRLKFTT